MNERKRILIVGARGIVSILLTDLIEEDQLFDIMVVPQDEIDTPNLFDNIDLVVLCTQDFVSPEIVKKLDKNLRVLDISPAFRTNPNWVYGMPELHGMTEQIRGSKLVANPGCFATSVILILEPLIKAGLVKYDDSLYVDATGGYSTGGSKMQQLAITNQLPHDAVYSLNNEHRHIVEIKKYTGAQGHIVMKPKIANVYSGIRTMMTFFDIPPQVIRNLYQETFQNTDVNILLDNPSKVPVDDWANKHGAAIRIYPEGPGSTVILTMDNLKKGAVDSAYQNIKLMLS